MRIFFTEYLINESERLPCKCDRKTYFGKEVICAHQVEEIFSRSEICHRFILKSPTIAHVWSISILGESTDINCCVFKLSFSSVLLSLVLLLLVVVVFVSVLLSWGGRYILPIVNVRQRLPPLMSINRPTVYSNWYMNFVFNNCNSHLGV